MASHPSFLHPAFLLCAAACSQSIDSDSDSGPDSDVDTDWDTEPLPPREDVEIDTETCEPSGQPESWQFGPVTDPEIAMYEWCVGPQTECMTWSQRHALSQSRCIRSARVSGCGAEWLAERRYDEDVWVEYFDGQGVLIASSFTSDTNLECDDPIQVDTDVVLPSAWTRWRGGRILGCQVVEEAYSADCLPDRGLAWDAGNSEQRRPVGPPTLADVPRQIGSGCHGRASCGPGNGTLVLVPTVTSYPEGYPYIAWYFDESGRLAGSWSTSGERGRTPERCQGAVVERVGSCGFLTPDQP